MKKYNETITMSLEYQGSTYEELLDLRGKKCRITIHSDNCQRQGWAHAELFDQTCLKWNQVAVIYSGAMETKPNLYVKRADNELSMRWSNAIEYSADRCTLLDKVLWILENQND